MDPLTKLAVERAARWWIANRPFSKEKREYRKERRRIRKENRQRKKQGLEPLPEPTKPEVASMFNLLFNSLRTSTVSSITGLLTYVVVNFVPADFLLAVEQFFTDAANADGGTVPFLVAAVVAFVAARLNKTPDNPGVL